MLSEISNAIKTLNKDPLGRKKRNLYLVFVVIIIALLFWNRMQLATRITDDLRVLFEESKLLFLNNLSPYDENVMGYIADNLEKEGVQITASEFDFELSIWKLIYYLPFAFIKDFAWGAALFMTTSQAFVLIAAYLMLSMLKGTALGIKDYLLIAIIFFSVFIFQNLFSATLAPLSFLFISACLFLDTQNKQIPAGILLGISVFDIIHVPIIIITLLVVLIKNKRFIAITWSIIAALMSTLFLIIFDRNWLLGWLKNLFLTPQQVPFLTYPEALAAKFTINPSIFLSIISFLLVIWMFYELWQANANSVQAIFWIISVSAIVNFLLILQNSFFPFLFLLFPYASVFSIWENRISGIKGYLLLIPAVIFSPLLLFLTYLYPIVPYNNIDTVFYSIFIIILILNLYWLKRWVTNPYDLDKNLEKYI